MIHAVCDFCGKDTDLTATLMTLTPFQNFARTHNAVTPFGTCGKPKSFVICSKCAKEKGLPNPYHDYNKIQKQDCEYKTHLGNYNEEDFLHDTE